MPNLPQQSSSAAQLLLRRQKKAALPKQPFDIFQEAALAARNFATEENGEMPQIEKHIKSTWRKVPSSQREEWQELLRIRKTCTDVSAKSRGLLESQGFLTNLVPDLRTHDSHPRGYGAFTADLAGPVAGSEQCITPSMFEYPE